MHALSPHGHRDLHMQQRYREAKEHTRKAFERLTLKVTRGTTDDELTKMTRNKVATAIYHKQYGETTGRNEFLRLDSVWEVVGAELNRVKADSQQVRPLCPSHAAPSLCTLCSSVATMFPSRTNMHAPGDRDCAHISSRPFSSACVVLYACIVGQLLLFLPLGCLVVADIWWARPDIRGPRWQEGAVKAR